MGLVEVSKRFTIKINDFALLNGMFQKDFGLKIRNELFRCDVRACELRYNFTSLPCQDGEDSTNLMLVCYVCRCQLIQDKA